MSLSRKFDTRLLEEDEATTGTLEQAVRALGGPGSGWHAEQGHVPGSQGGKSAQEHGTLRSVLNGANGRVEVRHSGSDFHVIHKGKLHSSHSSFSAAQQQGLDLAHRGYSRTPTGKVHFVAMAAAKLPQPVVLYMSPAQNEADFTCGGCTFATPDGQCVLLDPAGINLETGACGFYFPGTPHDQEFHSTPISPKMAGYEEDGPYTCGRCTHFITPSACEGVAGKIDAKGCCNAWEKAS